MLGLLLSPVYQCLFTPTVGILVCGGMALFVDGVSNLLPLPNRAQRKAPPAQHAVTKPDAAAPDELLPSLASLPADELRLIIDRLGPREFANFAQTSGALRALVDAQWSCLLDRFFHDDVSKPHARSQQERFQACFRPVAATKEDVAGTLGGSVGVCGGLVHVRAAAAGAPAAAAGCMVEAGLARLLGPRGSNKELGRAPGGSAVACTACGDSLESSWHPGKRCPCVAARGGELPLTLLSLDARRAGPGASLEEPEAFFALRRTLGALYRTTLRTPPRLEPGSLSGVDVAILATSEAQPLDEAEVRELQRFVERGGTALVSAFATTPPHPHPPHPPRSPFNESLVGWLGVAVNSPDADCEPRARHPTRLSPLPISPLPIAGPFGVARAFVNTGEAAFSCSGFPIAYAERCGLRLARHLAFFPRHGVGDLEGGTAQPRVPQGEGQVLVVSNLQCITNHHWASCADNRAIFLNLCASAAAWRDKLT